MSEAISDIKVVQDPKDEPSQLQKKPEFRSLL